MADNKSILTDMNSSWEQFFNKENRGRIFDIQEKIGNNYNPSTENVMRFLKNDMLKIKVVILGQDPYPEMGKATGRAFEVGGLNFWTETFRQVSLKNIVRLLHKNYNNIIEYEKIKSFSDIKNEIVNRQFEILPPNELFKSWESQGVLLLNAYLTCEVGKPGSHREIWRSFMKDLLKYISENNQNITWFLWGKDAMNFKEDILNGEFVISRHPMMCSSRYEDDFLKSECFTITKDKIMWLGIE